MADSQPPAPGDHLGAHEDHDTGVIAALLDLDISETDRSAAQVLVAICPSCAELHQDLLELARAVASVPIPTRPRDFSLTPAMAATLSAQATREPVPAGARLVPEMTDTRTRHGSHDRLLIANLIDRSVDEAERARAEELLAACHDCEQLYDDLVALSAATRAMALPARPRDFTLTAADAERLRVSGWRRLLGLVGSSRDAFSRPLALGLTTLGIAGLMVATIPSAFMGAGAASGPTLSTVGQAVGDTAAGSGEMYLQASGAPPAGNGSAPEAAAAAPSAAASPAAEALPAPSGDTASNRQEEPDKVFVGGESSPLAGDSNGDDATQSSLSSEGPITRSTTILVAGLFLVGGLLLFGLRWTARRLGDG